MHSICPLYFSSLVITSEAVTRDKVVHALPSRWRLKVVSPVSRGPRASPAAARPYPCARVRVRMVRLRHPALVRGSGAQPIARNHSFLIAGFALSRAVKLAFHT